MKNIIEIKNISSNILSDINASVAENEIFGLIGLNGAGKTTLIKTILNFSYQDSGQIKIYDLDNFLPSSRKNITYLPEKFQPSAYIKGIEFLKFSCSLSDVEFSLKESILIASEFDFEEKYLYFKIKEYSKGMLQKLGLMASFLLKKNLFIADEPMSGLDVLARDNLKRKFLDYRKRGGAIFFTSHLLADIEEICDRIAIINKGKIIYIGTVIDLKKKHQNNLEKSFLLELGRG